MTGFADFTVSTDELGNGTYLVNGQDVTDQVAQGAILIRPGQLTSLQLELRAGGKVDGRGIVKVLLDEAQAELPVAQAVLRFLDQVDPTELEQSMANGSMRAGIGAAAIAALKQMAVQ